MIHINMRMNFGGKFLNLKMAIPTTNLNCVIHFNKDVKVKDIISFLKGFENLDECIETYYAKDLCFVNREKGQETRILINYGLPDENSQKNVVTISPSVYKLNHYSFDFLQEVVTHLSNKFGIRVVVLAGTELDYENFLHRIAGLKKNLEGLK